jgi:putative transposase
MSARPYPRLHRSLSHRKSAPIPGNESPYSPIPLSRIRKTPAHPPPILEPDRATIVFVTICVAGRREILAAPSAHEVIVKAWLSAASWLVGRYTIMPEHLHFFCTPTRAAPPLADWISYWKKLTTRLWPRREETPVWQRGFWDTQLRRAESYDNKWLYMQENPVRRGLASRPENWPFQGTLNELKWWQDE